MLEREFDLMIILTAYTGKLYTAMDGLHEFLEFITGGPVWTHQIPRLFPPVQKELLRQLPTVFEDFEDMEGEFNLEVFEDWRELQYKTYGKTLKVQQMSIQKQDEHSKDPLSELVEMVGPERVIGVEL